MSEDEQQNEEQMQQEYDKKILFEEIVQRLKQAQADIKQTKQELEIEKQLRSDAEIRLEEKNAQIRNLLMKQNQTTTEKVEDQINNKLNTLVNQTIQRENHLKDLTLNLKERCCMNNELERQFRGLRHYMGITANEQEASDEQAQKLKIALQKQTNTNLLLKVDIDEKTLRISQLAQEAQNLRAAIHNLNDVKNVINRVTDKESSIIGTRNASNKKSRNGNGVVREQQQFKQQFNSYDVDDKFWYGDKSVRLPKISSSSKKR